MGVEMGIKWLCVSLFVIAVKGYEFDDEAYHQMPRLFLMDDYAECMSTRRGAYCLGTFDLLPYTNDRLLNVIKRFSEDKFNFNHTHLHRGVCVSSSCAPLPTGTLRARFERCVENTTTAQYGLRTNLTKLEYCRSSGRPSSRPIDGLDVAFAYFVGAIVVMNLVGTAYDVMRNKENKPNKYLIPWSLRASWARLTANYTDGDPRLAALKPIQGMKAITLMLVMMAHSVLAYHITYLYNPLFLEKASHHPMSAYFQNGTSIVQTFIMASSFLLAYNLLIYADADPKRKLGLHMFPKCFFHRITRISPVYMFVVGVTVTWWSSWGDGPLWAPLVGAECARCRDKWWAQLLYVNNLVSPHVRCLIHTWFLAVDMQLYVLSSLFVLSVGRRPRTAIRLLALLFVMAVGGNFLAAYYFGLRPMVTLMFPEHMRTQFEGESSFTWLYQAPWDSLPAAIIGLFVAYLHYEQQNNGYKPGDSLIIRWLYRLSVPSMFAWVVAGYAMKSVTAPLAVSLYAALDRPVFASLTALAMYGFFNQIDSIWWRFLSWRGFEVLGRMSLSIYLTHWLFALTQLALRTYLSPVSAHEMGGHFLFTMFVTYWTAVPLHLFVELPMQKFLQALFT